MKLCCFFHNINISSSLNHSKPSQNLLNFFKKPAYEITIDDHYAYEETWTTSWSKSWNPDEEFIEYFCHDNNRDQFHLVGNQ